MVTNDLFREISVAFTCQPVSDDWTCLPFRQLVVRGPEIRPILSLPRKTQPMVFSWKAAKKLASSPDSQLITVDQLRVVWQIKKKLEKWKKLAQLWWKMATCSNSRSSIFSYAD